MFYAKSGRDGAIRGLAGVSLALGLGGATAALAEGDALVIGNSGYEGLQLLTGAFQIERTLERLDNRGFETEVARDGDSRDMRVSFLKFVEGIDADTESLVVVLRGAFVHGASDAYLLPVEQDIPENPGRILTSSLSLDSVMTVLAAYPGRAFLVWGEEAHDADYGAFLEVGLGDLDIPQGVTVVRGPGADVMRFAATDMLSRGRPLSSTVRRYEIDLLGYAPKDITIVPARDDAAAAGQADADAGEQQPDADDLAAAARAAEAADNAAWRLAQQADTLVGYRTYLQGHPQGQHAAAARQRIKAIDDEPFYQDRRTEERLELSRDARRDIQRDLTILGYNTRGIDGIFGRGTRGAIQNWQRAITVRATGYLTAPQINRLDRAATARAAELEEEARLRREEQERQDRALWRQVQADPEEAALREYLERYPEGIYAQEARSLLEQIEARRAERAARADRNDWRAAREADTISAYRSYLEKRPGGAFQAEAKARIRELERAAEQEQNASRASQAERALNLNPVAKRLVEARLTQLGLKPGVVDGNFDQNTRRAIQKYQQARGIRATGYLDEETIIRLLAGGVGNR